MPSQAIPTPYTMRMPGRNRSRIRPSGMPNTAVGLRTRRYRLLRCIPRWRGRVGSGSVLQVHLVLPVCRYLASEGPRFAIATWTRPAPRSIC
jgi:hypothetical protein